MTSNQLSHLEYLVESEITMYQNTLNDLKESYQKELDLNNGILSESESKHFTNKIELLEQMLNDNRQILVELSNLG